MLDRFYSLVSFLFLLSSSSAQDFSPLIKAAWSSNEQLKSKEFSIQAAQASLAEAKAMFGPTASFGLQYSLAKGGRTIDLPIGDLLNPVYSSLNNLTQTQNFSQINNTSVQFLPNNFYEARVRISQPIYYPDLAINRKLKAESIEMRELERLSFKRSISHDVMKAYIQYSMAKDAKVIYLSADTLINQARRVTQSMIKNGIATPLALSRIENQQVIIQSNLIEANGNIENGLQNLFFITGIKEQEQIPTIVLNEMPDTFDILMKTREEIAQLDQAMTITQLGIDRERQFYKPKIGAILDLGSQDFNFGWSPYGLFGLNMDLSLYDHKRHKYKQDAFKADMMSVKSQRDYVSAQFELVSKIAHQNLITAVRQSLAVQPRIVVAQKVYQDALRRFKEGQTPYLELIDASTQITQIQTQYILARYNAWIKWSDYVYATASYQIQ